MLYPQSNAYRKVYNLNGLWKFATVGDGYDPATPLQNARWMPVPASYNELVVEKQLRDYIGKVAYEREFSVPLAGEKSFVLRVGAASHKFEVFLNGVKAGVGINGYYPIDIPLCNLQKKNRLTIVVDNVLDFWTFPPGRIEDGRQTINFDFYNFTGIHRDVLLYTLPEKPIEDIFIKTVYGGDYEKVCVQVKGDCKNVRFTVLNRDGEVLLETTDDVFSLKNPVLWEIGKPYLYTLKVETDGDEYEEPFGIRKVSFDDKGLYVNDKPVYLKGFCLHDDFFLIGKANNSAVNIRNFELLKWSGANSVRTSHYPYSEEFIRLADEYGILVIDEVPAVGMNAFRGEGNFTPNRMNEQTKALHKELIKLLWERDKNHPSMVMLSVANEPATEEDAARPYFQDVINYTRTLCDLPIMIAEVTKFVQESKVADLVDFTALNRYYGWYEEHGNLYRTENMLKDEFYKWHEKYGKPIIVTEFGADTLEGVHSLPSETFSEEYQRDFYEENCRVFDEMDFVVGEHVWNLADFRTKQGVIRPRGNRKGVFTRDRQPKAAAFWLKERWKNK